MFVFVWSLSAFLLSANLAVVYAGASSSTSYYIGLHGWSRQIPHIRCVGYQPSQALAASLYGCTMITAVYSLLLGIQPNGLRTIRCVIFRTPTLMVGDGNVSTALCPFVNSVGLLEEVWIFMKFGEQRRVD